MRSGRCIAAFAALMVASCASMHIDRAHVTGLGSAVGASVDTIGRSAPPMAIEPRIVFFDAGKATLTAEAQAVIGEAVLIIREGGYHHVLVSGHTDAIGTPDERQAISNRRADSVKQELMRLGIPADEIVVVGKADVEPMKLTPPNTSEPENRRAQIEYGP